MLTLGLTGVSVTAGTIGYHVLAGYDWDDAFHHSCLVLGEHSVDRHPETTAGKAFAGVYVMYARLVFFSAAAILILPILHRLHLEVPTDDLD